jgi:CO/xanthine dehydrogenase Mo-binding subunit
VGAAVANAVANALGDAASVRRLPLAAPVVFDAIGPRAAV